jgi:general secretion pathway protein I
MISHIAAPVLTRLAARTFPLSALVRRPEWTSPAGDAGFTLIEVVVALAVVAIALTAIGAVAATSARGTRSLEQHLALVETTRIVAATLPRSREASLDGLTGEILNHRWRISLAPFVGSGIYQMPDSQWIPQTVVVRVRSPSGAVIGFETVRLQPKAPPQ